MASSDYLIDSDVLIDHLRGYGPARDFLSALLLDGATLHFSVISEAEIYSNRNPSSEMTSVVGDALHLGNVFF